MTQFSYLMQQLNKAHLGPSESTSTFNSRGVEQTTLFLNGIVFLKVSPAWYERENNFNLPSGSHLFIDPQMSDSVPLLENKGVK